MFLSTGFYCEYRAKHTEPYGCGCSNGWAFGSLIRTGGESFVISPCGSCPYSLAHTCPFSDTGKKIPVDDTTICMSTQWVDSGSKKIYTGDIVQLGEFTKVIVWFDKRLQKLAAVVLDRNTYYDGTGFHNQYASESYSDFCETVADTRGYMHGKIHIIGNVFDNPELIECVEDRS